MTEIIDLNNKTITTVTKVSFSHDDFVEYYNGDYEINGFVGGVEVDISVISDYVPESFPNSTVSVDEETIRQKTFDEYCNYDVSLDSTKALLLIGYRDSNGNRKDEVKDAELRLWVEYFGIDNILTKSGYMELKASTSYTVEKDEL